MNTKLIAQLSVAAIAAAALMASVTSHAQVSGNVTISGKNANASISFGEQDRRYIEQYYVVERPDREGGKQESGEDDGGHKYKKQKKGLPPGLQKKLDREGQLPPGLQKRLSRGDTIPREVEKTPLPVELERKLVKLPPDYGRAVIGVDIVLFDKKSGVVLDIVGKLPL